MHLLKAAVAGLFVSDSRKPAKMYSRLELKRDARKTYKTVRKLVGSRQCRKDLKMVIIYLTT